MNRIPLSLSLLLAVMSLLTACSTPPAFGAGPTPLVPEGTPIVSHGSEVTDTASLLEGLREAGAVVEPAGPVEQPFFSVSGQAFNVSGQTVQMFEYASAAEAEAQAVQVSLSGSTIGTTQVSWIGTPNFFKAGSLIVLYIGDDQVTLGYLTQVLGFQFAGGPFASAGPSSAGGVVAGGGMPLPAADAAVKSLAALRGLSAESISVVSAEAMEWPDACLGVPPQDRACAQIVTPGYRVILQAGDEQVTYHTDEFGTVLVLIP